MKKALVQSVGTGTRPDMDITRPLLWHVRPSGATFVAWVVSDDSRPYAERMASELGLAPEEYEIRRVTAFEDVEDVYRECLALLRDLERRGFVPEAIEVDYTSGTKAMTAGLALAAVSHRCATLTYIAGDRQAGVVISGTERLVSIEPRRIWADERLRLARDYCLALRFDAALALVEGVNEAWLGEHERRVAGGLRAVAAGYGAWDRFDYGRAAGELGKFAESVPAELRVFQPDRALQGRLPALKPEAGITADRLADLFNNARRRLEEGRYDDALARLYRLTEMLAQWILRAEFHIDSADVDVAKVPPPLRARMEAQRGGEGRVQIGLTQDYELLEGLDHPAGRFFKENSSLGVLLKKRNESLLAHGYSPIGKREVEALVPHLDGLIACRLSDWQERLAALQFPWLRGSAPARGVG